MYVWMRRVQLPRMQIEDTGLLEVVEEERVGEVPEEEATGPAGTWGGVPVGRTVEGRDSTSNMLNSLAGMLITGITFYLMPLMIVAMGAHFMPCLDNGTSNIRIQTDSPS